MNRALTVLALLLLQLAFALFYWLPSRSVALALAPNIDMLVVVGSILIWNQIGIQAQRTRKALIGVFSLVIAMGVLLGIAQGVASREFGYDFALAYHQGKIYALFKMMYEAQSLPLFLLSIGLLVLVALALMAACAWALRRLFAVTKASTVLRRNLALGLTGYALVAGLLLGVSGPITFEIADQLVEAMNREERVLAKAKSIEHEMQAVEKLVLPASPRNPTVLVFVVESYGQVLFEDGKYSEFATFIRDSEALLSDHGFASRTMVYHSPVFGGSSWLANATILCRLSVPTEKMYFSLFQTDTRCMPRQFNDAGYESIFAGSNTTKIEEEYATLFPFDTFYTQHTFDYQGPRMSWSYMPDQYVIDTIERQVLGKPSEQPRFVYYKLSSSHHPWATIPSYIEDWNEVGNGAIYNKLPSTRYPDNAFLGGKHYNEGYYDSIEYSMRTVIGYLNQLPENREVLAVILGDHQPRRPVADMNDDSWTIPLHVISKDSALLQKFSHLGFTAGLNSVAGEQPLELAKFAEHLLTALGAKPAHR